MDADQRAVEQASVESPPVAPRGVDEDPLAQVRSRLHELARELIRGRNRKLLIEYLMLRRVLR
jgi:hypothetical protein